MPVIFFVIFPLTQEIENRWFFAWLNFTLMTGDEYLNPFADKYNQPFFSFTVVVIVWLVPLDDRTLTVAEIGAFVNP